MSLSSSASSFSSFGRRRAGSSSAEMQATESRVLPKTRYRIVVMGGVGVGKTCIISRLLYAKFLTEYRATVEELHSGQYEVNGLPVILDILDTSGSLEFPAMRRLAITNGDAFVLVYSVNDQASFDEVERLRQEIIDEKRKGEMIPGEGEVEGEETGEETPGSSRKTSTTSTRKGDVIPIVIVGNKTDLQNEILVAGEWKKRNSDVESRFHSVKTTAVINNNNRNNNRNISSNPDGDDSHVITRRRSSLLSVTAESTARIDWGHGYVEVSAKDDVNISGIFKSLLAQVDLQLVPDVNSSTSVEEQRKAKYFARFRKHPKLAKRNSCQVS